MTTESLFVLVLLAVSFVLTGAAWLVTMLIHVKVNRTTTVQQASTWNHWSQVAKTYPIVCPGGRLLFWRSLFQALGLCSFIAIDDSHGSRGNTVKDSPLNSSGRLRQPPSHSHALLLIYLWSEIPDKEEDE